MIKDEVYRLGYSMYSNYCFNRGYGQFSYHAFIQRLDRKLEN